MTESLLLDPIQILHGSKKKLIRDAVLIQKGKIKAFGNNARALGKEQHLLGIAAQEKVLAPCLVDPHSVLEEPLNGQVETLTTFRQKASAAGYGQVALLPRSPLWRDHPERLIGFKSSDSDVFIHLWGSISKFGKGLELSPHADLIEHGAIGLAEDDYIPPIEILKKSFVIGELKKHPLLVAPRDLNIQSNGIAREGVETLRAGWPQDPVASETLPLSQLLDLHKQHPEISMRLMNISTSAAVSMIANSETKPMSTVCWWHLLKDNSCLANDDIGWRVLPSLGGPKDREDLINALKDGILSAVAVHSIPLCDEEIKAPPDQRQPGLCGHELVLPSLWQELVIKWGWSVEQLWEALSFGPSKMLQVNEERLEIGSDRWLLFDPYEEWTPTNSLKSHPYAANQALNEKPVKGKVIRCGLKSQEVPND